MRAADVQFREVAEAFEDLGAKVRVLGHERTAEAVVQVAVEHVPGADHCSMTVLRGQVFTTPAATSDLAVRADLLQYELGSGPCVDAILDDALYAPRDLSEDSRWPEFGRRAADELGLRSMLSYRLSLEEEGVIAGLNVYANSPGSFDLRAVELGWLLATHASLAVSADHSRQRADNLQQALESNRDIGVAIGVLMTLHKLTRQQAFDLLRVASQQSNRKLRDIANDVTETGALDLPGVPLH